MELPASAIFAFNTNIDHIAFAGKREVEKIGKKFPEMASAMAECFSSGVQREIQVGKKECSFLLDAFEYQDVVGGQAGNAALQASMLGVECYLHSNFWGRELLSLFPRKEKILVFEGGRFVNAAKAKASKACAHHFVFENKESRTRIIFSYDPIALHPESGFCSAVEEGLVEAKKAFVGGLHLAKTKESAKRLIEAIKRWKKANLSLQVFLELGEFQNRQVMEMVEKCLFAHVDFVGMNEHELAAFGCPASKLAEKTGALLLHSPERQEVYPKEKEDRQALLFAAKAASFKAKYGKCASKRQLATFQPRHVRFPARTVGLGDTFSAAYFMALP